MRLLIAEDDVLIGDMIRDAAVDAGYDLCGLAASVGEALALAERSPPDLAIIDVRLADGDGMELAAVLLRQRRIGILFASGNCEEVLRKKPAGTACLGKPFTVEQLIAALRYVERATRDGATPLPLPRGVRLIEPRGAS